MSNAASSPWSSDPLPEILRGPLLVTGSLVDAVRVNELADALRARGAQAEVRMGAEALAGALATTRGFPTVVAYFTEASLSDRMLNAALAGHRYGQIDPERSDRAVLPIAAQGVEPTGVWASIKYLTEVGDPTATIDELAEVMQPGPRTSPRRYRDPASGRRLPRVPFPGTGGGTGQGTEGQAPGGADPGGPSPRRDRPQRGASQRPPFSAPPF